jgi:hypothetical protein
MNIKLPRTWDIFLCGTKLLPFTRRANYVILYSRLFFLRSMDILMRVSCEKKLTSRQNTKPCSSLTYRYVCTRITKQIIQKLAVVCLIQQLGRGR